MKKAIAVAATGVLFALVCARAQTQDSNSIDWNYAQKLYQKSQSGQALSADEKTYLDRARQERARGNGPGGPAGGRGQGPASRLGMAAATSQRSNTGLVPLDQMTAKDSYKGQDGGLYGDGKNEPPSEHLKAARQALAQVGKLDADGKPSPGGKIVLLSVGMSNTTNEFSRFQRDVAAGGDKSPAVVVVDGAQGGQTAPIWASEGSKVWPVVEQRLQEAQATAKQVQVVWLKQALAQPRRLGEFPAHAKQLEESLIQDVNQVLQHYPNVKVIYFSSRIYAGYAVTELNPEPFAYESGFSVRWVIQDQIKGDARLNYDPQKGEVKAPVLLWGPYLWADGVTPRKSDGLTYEAGELAGDGTHPGPAAQEKVSKMLQALFKSELNAGWYVRGGAQTQPAK